MSDFHLPKVNLDVVAVEPRKSVQEAGRTLLLTSAISEPVSATTQRKVLSWTFQSSTVSADVP